ncbi:glycerol-3-phosphate 1-O-acyltransferase PlsY [Halomonas sp. McH1-25]|uniref:glycerol-3-phosphate 1-O-acyltransferase PlsY n=2 Tax=Halomonas TaxID=2745 RepID=UPI001EF71357|nr:MULTISPECIES: glycerol-3-phosphate 1-O-acyltransferase PlsY [unclassified Halomonas]MCG7600637.1 glycerol-3-phosphate 1-O-acyltransferase PlsY [Halomonas sp. McH1-25]MCP1341215.1 glycerol-3-phosphate 1-O-acyltransferase PlsY [Halomonas sp. FL8]
MPLAALVTHTTLLTLMAYLCGACLGAVWVCRLRGLPDPRLRGSFNPGFSNVLRLYGKRLALVTLLFDAGKAVPVLWLAKGGGLPAWAQGVVGLGVLLGHSYPIWHRWRGGKAVASAFGVLLMLTPTVALLCAACWALLAWRVRTAAIASLASALLAPLASVWLARDYVWVVIVFALLVVLRHVWNIQRLGRGEEPPLNDGKLRRREE